MMNYHNRGTDIAEFDAVRLSVASEKDILDWSYGEVTKPETINYRTQKPERDGLFCEKIFGPVKDINPHDAKYKGVRSREAAVDKNGELVTKSIVRRERMGHIGLASPVVHIWFLRGTPSPIGLLLGMTIKNLERVAYFASYVITEVDKDKLEKLQADKVAEFEAAKSAIEERFKKEGEKKDADAKQLAKDKAKELDELETNHDHLQNQLNTLEPLSTISENEYRDLPDELVAGIKVAMGGNAIKSLLEKIDLSALITALTKEVEEAKGQRKKKIMKRLRLVESMHRAGIDPASMCLTVIPVIPPDLRPMVQLTGGRFATSDLNDLYRRVINRNNRLKKLIELNAPEVIRRNEQRMLQEAVDALIDNNSTRGGRAITASGQRRRYKSLSDMLKGKQGRFRQNLLGKRVDYSGRSVIVAGPDLKLFQCGLPKMMALELFKPFVIGKLISDDQAHNIRSATRMIETGELVVWDTLDEVIKGKYVLLNRAPSLHRLSIQAFQPVLIEGKAIQLHPLVCKGFNADFDGDQMAVHLPLSDDAQKEARELMSSSHNLLKPADGSPILHIEQDIVLGCYYLTYERPGEKSEYHPYADIGEAVMAYDRGTITLQDRIRVNFRGEKRDTTLGRIFFNEVLPEDFPYQNEPMTKKRIVAVLNETYNRYGSERTALIADELKHTGFFQATRAGLSIGMDDFREIEALDRIIQDGEKVAAEISNQFEEGFITEDERYRLTVENWMKTDTKVQDTLATAFVNDDSSMSVAVVSGARGNIGQVKTAVGLLGIVTDATGRAIELPIRSSYKKGLSPLEYFTATRGARKGMIDTALKTADSGYLTRRLVDVAQDVFTTEQESEDPGFSIMREDAQYIGVAFGSRIEGRFAAENVGKYVKKDELISKEAAAKIDADEKIKSIRIYSALSSTSVVGVSQKAYGLDPATGELVKAHHPVGVIAAQSIGEPGTQLTLKTFHAGGVAGEDITTGLPRVEELFEVRTPKGQAYLSEVSGDVKVIEEEQITIEITPHAKDKITLELSGQTSAVKTGAEVKDGDLLADPTDTRPALRTPVAGKVEVKDGTITITPSAKNKVRYEIPSYKQVLVTDDDRVIRGQRLTNGSINLHELMHLQGVEATQRYIMNEVLRIFASQGQNINDKHLEIIVRQMFSRVQIEDAGDSDYVIGDIVSKLAVHDVNQTLEAKGKKTVKYNQLLLGITKASLNTESFLSAASFQDTTRVLIAAATSGKVDKLFGLKENVILGRKIPVGTGYQDPNEETDESEMEEV